MECLDQYKKEVEAELSAILNYWLQNTVDKTRGGFYGKVNNANVVDEHGRKGCVMHARILWAFAAAYNFCGEEKYMPVSARAFEYIKDHFIDEEFGGVFWSVDAAGNLPDTKKQVYALAFCIYGLSEYYTASKNEEALLLALSLYDLIERYSYDNMNKGYIEAFTRDWKIPGDLRLSAKDANEKKTMNTHLHIIEAYANLYKVYETEELANKIRSLLELFHTYFIDHKTFHLKLFFDEVWTEKAGVISYGHDIEAAWLLQQCAEIIGDKDWLYIYKAYAVKIADAVTEGLDKDGGLWHEYEPQHQKLVQEKHWWPQAEAMVGFLNAWQITKNEKYLQHSLNTWRFTKKYIIDKQNGEWFWGVKEDNNVMQNEDKAGLWKCPYHNSRACMEVMRRIP